MMQGLRSDSHGAGTDVGRRSRPNGGPGSLSHPPCPGAHIILTDSGWEWGCLLNSTSRKISSDPPPNILRDAGGEKGNLQNSFPGDEAVGSGLRASGD